MNLKLRKYIKQLRLRRFYRNFVNKGDLCFDIGAHAGERTQALASLGVRVICIEPQSDLYKKLARRFRGNDNVTVLHCAAGSVNGEADLMLCSEHSACSTLSQEFISVYGKISGLHWTTTEKVSVRTPDNLIAGSGHPQLIKLDIEGMEAEVLKTLSLPVDQVHFEFNYPMLNDALTCLQHLERLQKYELNFIRYEIMRPVLPEWVSMGDFISNIHNYITPDILTGEILCRRVMS